MFLILKVSKNVIHWGILHGLEGAVGLDTHRVSPTFPYPEALIWSPASPYQGL